MSRKEARITPIRPATASVSESQIGARIGRIVAVNEQGLLVVESTGTPQRPAKLAVALDADRLQAAIESRQPAVLVFENGDESLPIVIGLVEPTPETQTKSAQAESTARADSPVIEADVDGRRVRLVAQDEIVLECGPASITLRRNGRVVIRGTHVESHSDGANRIKGGQVRIN
jgi:hypothetical protein